MPYTAVYQILTVQAMRRVWCLWEHRGLEEDRGGFGGSFGGSKRGIEVVTNWDVTQSMVPPSHPAPNALDQREAGDKKARC